MAYEYDLNYEQVDIFKQKSIFDLVRIAVSTHCVGFHTSPHEGEIIGNSKCNLPL